MKSLISKVLFFLHIMSICRVNCQQVVYHDVVNIAPLKNQDQENNQMDLKSKYIGGCQGINS